MTHDYIHHGTTTLFAALNVLDGTVIGRCMQRHRHEDFIRFLNAVKREIPADLTLDKQILAEAARGNYGAPRAGAPVSSTSCRRWAFPSAAPVRCSASTDRHSGWCRGAVMTRSGSRPTSSSWHGSMAATATARSPPCCGMRAGW
jgi:hypothetical protein